MTNSNKMDEGGEEENHDKRDEDPPLLDTLQINNNINDDNNSRFDILHIMKQIFLHFHVHFKLYLNACI